VIHYVGCIKMQNLLPMAGLGIRDDFVTHSFLSSSQKCQCLYILVIFMKSSSNLDRVGSIDKIGCLSLFGKKCFKISILFPKRVMFQT
jgi:hypothetical protein